MNRLKLFASLALSTTLLIPAVSYAQDQGQGQGQQQGQNGGGGGGGGERGGRRGGGGGGNFDPAQMRERMTQMLKDQLGTTDEEWTVMQPKIEKVMTAQQDLRGGFGGRRGPGGGQDNDQARSPVQQAQRDLRQTLENKDAPADEITRKLEALREARTAAKTSLETAQKELKEVLTPRQEAVLVSFGMLD